MLNFFFENRKSRKTAMSGTDRRVSWGRGRVIGKSIYMSLLSPELETWRYPVLCSPLEHVDCSSDGQSCLPQPDLDSIWFWVSDPCGSGSVLWECAFRCPGIFWGSKWSVELPPIGIPVMPDHLSAVTECSPDFASRQLWTCCPTWWQH